MCYGFNKFVNRGVVSVTPVAVKLRWSTITKKVLRVAHVLKILMHKKIRSESGK